MLGFLGLGLSTVGLDPVTGLKRFTFGNMGLQSGIAFIPVMIGLLGLGEVFYQMYDYNKKRAAEELEARKINQSLGRVIPTGKEMKKWMPRNIIVGLATGSTKLITLRVFSPVESLMASFLTMGVDPTAAAARSTP